MRKRLMTYFSFSKQEYNGLLVLVGLILLVKASPFVYTYFWPEEYHLKREDKLLQELVLIRKKEKEERRFTKSIKKERKVQLFPFDPNQIDLSGWQQLGLSEKQAAAIIRYRAKGGKFYRAEDVEKMYTISPALYAQLLPYIYVDKNRLKKDTPANKVSAVQSVRHPAVSPHKEAVLPVIEINHADLQELDQIRGIGPFFAKRILTYREKLGGFYQKEQLKEVPGLDSLKYAEIEGQVRVDPGLLQKININTLTEADYRKLPYFTYKQVKAVIQFREQHGNYGNIADLKKVVILSPETLDKIAPYISF